MRHVAPLAFALASLLVGACTVDGRLLPLDRWMGTPSPSPTGPCEIVGIVPAAMFAVGVTSPASAGATVSLEPWLMLHAPRLQV